MDKKLIRGDKSVLYTVDRINKTLLSKAKKSLYQKDKIFYKYYFDLENKNALYESSDDILTPKKKSSTIPFYMPFVKQRKDIDKWSALYSIKAPFELLHADIANIRFFSKSAAHQKYCLVAVDLFTSKT